jgi:hypothetical protein
MQRVVHIPDRFLSPSGRPIAVAPCEAQRNAGCEARHILKLFSRSQFAETSLTLPKRCTECVSTPNSVAPCVAKRNAGVEIGPAKKTVTLPARLPIGEYR